MDNRILFALSSQTEKCKSSGWALTMHNYITMISEWSVWPLWDPGKNQRHPFSSVVSTSGIQTPMALGGSVNRKVESWWGVTEKRQSLTNYKYKIQNLNK